MSSELHEISQIHLVVHLILTLAIGDVVVLCSLAHTGSAPAELFLDAAS